MSTPLLVLCAIGGGALAGALGGVVAALITLTARRLRNRVLLAREVPVPRDLRFPVMFVKMCGVVGLILSGGSVYLVGLRPALLLALLPPLLLAMLGIGYALSDAREAKQDTRKSQKA